ncbi:MAG: hypothetical protein WKF77_30040 [Planctomycetaceae bacterium]
MSTSYRCKPVLPWKTLLDGLETAGLKIELSAEDSNETRKVLRDPDSGHYCMPQRAMAATRPSNGTAATTYNTSSKSSKPLLASEWLASMTTIFGT